MAKKVVKKLVKKTYAGQITTPKVNSNNDIANTTNFAKKIYKAVENNINYKKSSRTDDKTGEPIYINKTSFGPSKAVKGTVAIADYGPNAVDTKKTEPTMIPRPVIKKGGAIMAKKKMGGTTKAKKK